MQSTAAQAKSRVGQRCQDQNFYLFGDDPAYTGTKDSSLTACAKYKQMGFCTHPLYMMYMFANCEATCVLCKCQRELVVVEDAAPVAPPPPHCEYCCSEEGYCQKRCCAICCLLQSCETHVYGVSSGGTPFCEIPLPLLLTAEQSCLLWTRMRSNLEFITWITLEGSPFSPNLMLIGR